MIVWLYRKSHRRQPIHLGSMRPLLTGKGRSPPDGACAAAVSFFLQQKIFVHGVTTGKENKNDRFHQPLPALYPGQGSPKL